ncbi:MAG: 3-hydroxyacyl-CoA dehydrogenase [Gammaproteobacteria bacterium]|nr:MAG: 3-hydroxyacyl-CoA dehydrogenase [Gammaproteobacteria bacterium]
MFKHIAVIGSGTMGSGIAGQIANAGHKVLLLDLRSEGDDPDAIANAAVERLQRSDPPALVHPAVAGNIETGNLEDDFDRLGDADWVVEAIVERLDIKRDLYHRLMDVVSEDCIVTSNTSTIPIRLLVEGLPLAFQRRFAITHYFNPVRYMRLLEFVHGEHTDDEVMDALADFNDCELGKGVVVCNDTPGFLGNRVGVFALQVGIDEALRQNLPIETADALMGRPMGIPKTGVFGLYDLIGIDLMADVVRSLGSILPADDAFHAVGAESDMINGMVDAGLTGNKGEGGFYRGGEGAGRLARDLASGDYRAANEALPERVERAADAIAAQEEPLHELVAGEDAEARFCRNVLGRVLAYAAGLLGEVTDSPAAIDDAMKLGFNWVRGPFEMIDALGADTVAGFARAAGAEVPAVLEQGGSFQVVEAGVLKERAADGTLRPLVRPEGVVRFHELRRTCREMASNPSASLFDVGNGIRLVEFHSKANVLDDDSMAMVAAAAADPGRGILVHNDAQHYSAGVDLNTFLALIDAANWDEIDAFLARFQNAVQQLRYTAVPVVGAPSGLALGGGFEVLLHCDALVVHTNSVVGLVEAAVGLVPAGGGVKETYLRWYRALGDWQEAAWKTWMNIGYGATASSPRLATKLRYFREGQDREVMNRDRLYTAALALIETLRANASPPAVPSFELAGGDIIERMERFMDEGMARGDFFPHDKTVAMAVASIVCSDDGNAASASEQDLYDRERRAFIRLARTPETRARIHAMLHGGGAIRN